MVLENHWSIIVPMASGFREVLEVRGSYEFLPTAFDTRNDATRRSPVSLSMRAYIVSVMPCQPRTRTLLMVLEGVMDEYIYTHSVGDEAYAVRHHHHREAVHTFACTADA